MNIEIHHETLDPDDWDEMRALSHRMVDDANLHHWKRRDH